MFVLHAAFLKPSEACRFEECDSNCSESCTTITGVRCFLFVCVCVCALFAALIGGKLYNFPFLFLDSIIAQRKAPWICLQWTVAHQPLLSTTMASNVFLLASVYSKVNTGSLSPTPLTSTSAACCEVRHCFFPWQRVGVKHFCHGIFF